MAQREQRVTPLELFFDLVFVYAITQVTQLMSHDPTWRGVARGVLVLAALWWAWTGYAWLTNTLEPEEGQVRAGMFGAMAALLVVALAVPEAFESDAVLFGVDYLGALIGHGAGWRVSPAHFAERHGLIVIIALGESIIAIGVGSRGDSLTSGILSAAVLGIVAIAALWWSYFDVIAVLAQRQLSETSGATQARLARDYYSYLHLPMIAGIVLFALGLKRTIEQIDEPLATIPAVALCGGLSLYFLTHVALRIRLVHFIRRATTERPGWIGPGRLVTGIAMLALIPAALELPALASLALVTGVCCALIAWDVIHYREDRLEVRRARP